MHANCRRFSILQELKVAPQAFQIMHTRCGKSVAFTTDSQRKHGQAASENCEAQLPTGRLSQIDNVKLQRLDTLSRILRCGDGLRKAYEWIAQTKQAGRFRGPVYGPILLEVECQDEQHTRYLENQVSSMDNITPELLVHALS